MALNKQSLAERILRLKQQWYANNSAGNQDQANAISQEAQQYYNQLRALGEGKTADDLSGMNYAQAGAYVNGMAKNDTYNRRDVGTTIANLKNDWQYATNNGDSNTANYAADRAQRYYQKLRDNGDSSYAGALSNKDAEDALNFGNDYDIKSGRTAIRPYLQTKAKQYGLSDADMAKIITYDSDTGEVSVGGQNIGKPAGVSSDGVSYWDDTSKLDNAFDDYINRSGTTKSKDTMANQNWQTYQNENGEAWGMNKENPFTTETGKSILEKYGLKGLTARDNAAATAASSNGGNIDSYAAANAMRQQAALTSLGAEEAIKAHDSKISNAINLLNQLGVNTDKMFGESITDRTTKIAENNADANNYKTRAEADAILNNSTGFINQSTYDTYNPYIKDGKVINGSLYGGKDIGEDINILKQKYDEAIANGDNDAATQYMSAAQYAQKARAYKINSNPDLAQYADSIDTSWITPKYAGQTAQERQNVRDNELGRYVSDNNLKGQEAGYEAQKYGYDAQKEANEHISDNSLAASNYAADKKFDETANTNKTTENIAAGANSGNSGNSTSSGSKSSSSTSNGENFDDNGLLSSDYKVVDETMKGFNDYFKQDYNERHDDKLTQDVYVKQGDHFVIDTNVSGDVPSMLHLLGLYLYNSNLKPRIKKYILDNYDPGGEAAKYIQDNVNYANSHTEQPQ